MTDDIFEKLSELAQLDIDAVNAYEQAIEKIDESSIRSRLEYFKADHQRHVDDISAYLIDNGREAPEQSPDFKGFLLEGFTSLRSITGTDGALKAMETNEKLTNKKYEDASSWDLDTEAQDIVMRGLDDERNHLVYIEEQLSVRAH